MLAEVLGLPGINDRYRILQKIGSGGMGEVYLARDGQLDREVAIKVLPPGTLADESARKLFRKEALALSRLNHPNIAIIHDFGRQNDIDFLVMEYIPGITLSDKIAAGPLTEKEIARLGTQLAQGLVAAHEHGVIHRDLKPRNVRVTPDGRLKVLDFGLAKALSPGHSDGATTESSTHLHGAAGTLPYMAPEQLQEKNVDARADIYAAGMVLYEMATGRRPFEFKSTASLITDILHSPPPPPGRLRLTISPRLEEIILKCLEKEPENRYQSANDLQIDLRRLAPSALDNNPLPAAGGRKSPGKGVRRFRFGVQIAVALAVVLLGVGVAILKHQPAGAIDPGNLAGESSARGKSPPSVAAEASTPSQVPAPPIAAPPIAAETKASPPPRPDEAAKGAVAAKAPASSARAGKSAGRGAPSESGMWTRDDIPDLLGQADACMAKGDYEKAISRYEQVLVIDPQSQRARDGLKRAKDANAMPH
jgi:serine/threonine protein kinase